MTKPPGAGIVTVAGSAPALGARDFSMRKIASAAQGASPHVWGCYGQAVSLQQRVLPGSRKV